MENLQGYVRWRGDLTFAERPFNVADNLVLSAAAYLDLSGLVPAGTPGASITIADATRLLDESAGDLAPRDDRRLAAVPPSLLTDLGRSARFGSARLSHVVDTVDDTKGMQFAAVTVHLDDGTAYVAFRGTDNTILGWQEDFTMSFQVMPAQTRAAEYLAHRVAESSGPVRVGGHSKGGNLAVYAAMRLAPELRPSVLRVYSNDGPGLSPEAVDAHAALWLEEHVEKIVPEFGVVGMLFDDGGRKRVVASRARGLIQHDLMTWGVEGSELVEVAQPSRRADLINRAFDSWMKDADDADRRDFTEGFFGALREGGADLIVDIGRSEYGSYESVVFALQRASGKMRRSTWLGMRATVRAVREIGVRSVVRDRTVARCVLGIVLGVFFIVVPDLAIQILGSLAIFVMLAVVTMRLVTYLWRFRRRYRLTWPRAALWLAVLAGSLFGIAHIGTLVTPTNVLLGVGLIVNAWVTARRALSAHGTRPRRRGTFALLVVSAVVSVVLGTVALSTADRVLPLFVLQVGQYFLVAGLIELLISTHHRAAQLGPVDGDVGIGRPTPPPPDALTP